MAAVEFDLSSLENWADNAEKILKSELEAFLEESIGVLASEFVRRAANRTPIGNYDNEFIEFTTKEGKLVKFKNRLHGKQGGDLQKAWTVKEKKVIPGGVQAIVHNTADYAPYVEYGHIIRNTRGGTAKGFVKGKRMMRNTEIEMTFEMPVIMKKRYERFLKKVLE